MVIRKQFGNDFHGDSYWWIAISWSKIWSLAVSCTLIMFIWEYSNNTRYRRTFTYRFLQMLSVWRMCESRSVVEFIVWTIYRLLSWLNYPDAVPGNIYRYHPMWCEVYTMYNRILFAFIRSQWFFSLDQREMTILRHCVSQNVWQITKLLLFFIKYHVWAESIHPSIDPPIHPPPIHPSVHPYIHTYIYICLLLSILMLWHRQAIFESKGDTLSSPAECKIRSWEVWNTKSPTDGMITHKPTELSEIKRNLNSVARPYDERALSLLDFTASWLRTWLWRYKCLLLLILMLWQTDDFWIKMRQVVFPYGMQDSKRGSLKHQIASRLNAHSQNVWAIKDQAKFELDAVSGHDNHNHPAKCEVYIMNNRINFAFLKSLCILLPLDQRGWNYI